MIYRVRVKKSQFSIGPTTKGNFLKISLGRRVWYFERGQVFHNLHKIVDKYGERARTVVEHYALPWRKTVYRTAFND